MIDVKSQHSTKELSLVVQFADTSENIRKELLTFVGLLRITGECIAAAILDIHNKLSFDTFRGQCYDGAEQMSGQRGSLKHLIKCLIKGLYTITGLLGLLQHG